MKLLVVEDEVKLLESIIHYFKQEKIICEGVSRYSDAIEKISQFNYDCIIVDITLPDGNGFDIVREVRKKKKNTGIIIISARDSAADKITGLDIGSDDYLAKPFHLSELNARIKALMRRIHFDGTNIIEMNEIRVDLNKQEARVNDTILVLTQKEYQLLLFLLSNKDRVITKNSIAEHLWRDEYSYGSYDFIYTHMKNLRKKLLSAGCKDYIKTVYGIGYKFDTK